MKGWVAGLGALALLAVGCTAPEVQRFDEGVELAKAGQVDQAARAYEDALKQKPSLVEARLNLGAQRYKQRRYADAEREFKWVLDADPDNVQARENLALTLEMIGDREEEALFLWKQVEGTEDRKEWKTRVQDSIKRLQRSLDNNPPDPLSIQDVPTFRSAPRPDDLAVVVGIESYQKLPDAAFARADANLVVQYVRAMGYPERNIHVVTDNQATANGMKSAFGWWLRERARPTSRVLVYYSGHGVPNPVTREIYLMPHDGNPQDLENTGFSVKTLYEKLGAMRVKEIVVVMDTCFAGQGSRSVLASGVKPAIATVEDPVLAAKHMAVLASAQGAQISTSSKRKKHGALTYYFLGALKQGKHDLASIYEFVAPLVEDEAKRQHVIQTPVVKPSLEQVKGRFTLW
jgi:hypothetical protein